MSGPPDDTILVVEPADGRLGALLPELEARGTVVVRAATVAAACAAVRAEPRIALVTLGDGIEAGDAIALVAGVKAARPDLPILLVQRAIDATALLAEVQRLLRQRRIPAYVVDALRTLCIEAMRDAYATELAPLHTEVAAQGVALGQLAAVLPFSGQRASGRLVVGGDRPWLAQILARSLPGAALTPEDLAGEYANLVAGLMKSYLIEDHDLECQIDTPVVMPGDEVGRRFGAARRMVIFTLGDAAGALRVGFCFDALDVSSTVTGMLRRDVSAPGTFRLL